ncbi:hypothetical protein VCRA2123O444_50024 [Vibrio crassostreae]|nr:hypothetical protein VCRA2114O422_50024 [Vibrio crassostreae]CAK2152825.1 hypothetical protein VCRA2119O431_50128 [Vibrio crassostreae]CAK2161987.1 hypothetical protein VCRA2119O430_60024 [Vibrio crassostreae]CAK2166512.1 hypothetical protein VCRA2113O409_70024 [Vibrio crassostreae]CAK2168564.1 hypothetical protein VCRA2113O412_70024 [Vibrio crassostreae]
MYLIKLKIKTHDLYGYFLIATIHQQYLHIYHYFHIDRLNNWSDLLLFGKIPVRFVILFSKEAYVYTID